jgi:hypothetical protein
MDKREKFIYESPDGGNTVFRRVSQHMDRELVSKSNLDLFTYLEFNEIKRLSETNPSLKIALENLLLIYYTIKDEREDRT